MTLCLSKLDSMTIDLEAIWHSYLYADDERCCSCHYLYIVDVAHGTSLVYSSLSLSSHSMLLCACSHLKMMLCL